MRAIVAATVLAVLAGCSPGATQKHEPETAAAPAETMQQTFKGCTWGETKSTLLSIWAYACGPEAGNTHVVANGSGFDIESVGPDGASRRPVVRVFEKPPAAAIDAILPAVRLVSRGPASDTCAFEPATGVDHAGHARFNFAPTGAAKTAWDASVAGSAPGDPPCGDMGVSFVGDRVFEEMPDHPDTVLFIDFGSEIQIFDANTIKALK